MVASNTGDYQSGSVIQMRLDTTRLLHELEAFYRGKRVVGYREDESGVVGPVFQDIGRARMNDEGIQDVMSWLSSLFNPQTVQGNKKTEEFEKFMSDLHADFAQSLMTNLSTYAIRESDFEGIVDKTMAAADMFFSRTIDNEERNSYGQTFRSVERVGENRGGVLDHLPFRRR